MLDDQIVGIAGSSRTVFHLFLELADANGRVLQDPYGLRLAQAKQSISRDILVPGSFTLSQMHHCIQHSFGWKNMHLHKFSLPENDFNILVEDRIERYELLCGSLFRFPADDSTDLYWSRYCSLLSHMGASKQLFFSDTDSYYENLRKISRFHRLHPDLSGKTLTALRNHELRFDANVLLEHLQLQELFVPERAKTDPPLPADCGVYRELRSDSRVHEDRETWYTRMAVSAELVREHLLALEEADPDEFSHMTEALDVLRTLRNNYIRLELLSHSETEVHAVFGMPIAEAREALAKEMQKHLHIAAPLLIDYRPELQPAFPSLHYHYDRGDEWCVRIFCKGIYPLPLCSCPSESLASKILHVDRTNQPLCIRSDGLGVFEDIGGLSGYFDFLRQLRRSSGAQARAMREMAECYGWRSHPVVPEELL